MTVSKGKRKKDFRFIIVQFEGLRRNKHHKRAGYPFMDGIIIW